MTEAHEVGHWEDDVFILDHEIAVEDEHGHQVELRRIDFSRMKLPEGITREDVLHVMLNPIEVRSMPS